MNKNNLQKIKNEFPIFKNNKGLVYLDSANSSQKPQSVIDAISNFYSSEYANIGRGIYSLAGNALEKYEKTKILIKKFINAGEEYEIIFTKNATEALNLVASCFGEQFIKKNDEILLTELEHHSNYVPWHFLRKKKAIIKFIPVSPTGELNMEYLKSLINRKTKIISIVHISNVTGAINPIEEIIEIANKKKIPVCIDGTQAVAHHSVDIKIINPDFYVFSGHKIYGPTGVGILCVKKKWLDHFEPFLGGGGMVEDVTNRNINYAKNYNKFEPGTMPVAEVTSLQSSINLLNKISIKKIVSFEKAILDYALDKFMSQSKITLIGNPKEKGSLFSFNIEGIHSHDVATILDSDKIAVRAGHHCCQILHKKFNISSSVRVSLGIYNSKEDIDKLLESVKKCKKIFKI